VRLGFPYLGSDSWVIKAGNSVNSGRLKAWTALA
jgi:hypothetical protein